jgi:hypothetical protein
MVDAHFRAHQQNTSDFQFLPIERKSSKGPDDEARLDGIAFEFVRPLSTPQTGNSPGPFLFAGM